MVDWADEITRYADDRGDRQSRHDAHARALRAAKAAGRKAGRKAERERCAVMIAEALSYEGESDLSELVQDLWNDNPNHKYGVSGRLALIGDALEAAIRDQDND